ncbi:MAG: thioredoxin domain-containing protein [Chloroflexota bacterium]|nr:thioredoxin domain-containing protein [Chloroflexota bacterium]
MLSTEHDIVADYADTGKIRYVYSPILDHGPTAKTYQAAECAGDQDPVAFWAIHDLFYSDQNQLWSADMDTYADFAARSGVPDLAQFRQCLETGQFAEKTIALDRVRRGEGIRLRPTFSINGLIIPGAQSYAQLAALIDEALAAR